MMMALHREEITEEARKKQAYLRSQDELKEQLELTKAERLHRAFIHSHFIKEALEETESPAWRVALERKSEREQRKARFYQQLLVHQAKQQVCFAMILLDYCCSVGMVSLSAVVCIRKSTRSVCGRR